MELALRLGRIQAPDWLYDLVDSHSENRLCISQSADGWEVYFVERGEKWDVERFASEGAACQRMYERIMESIKRM